LDQNKNPGQRFGPDRLDVPLTLKGPAIVAHYVEDLSGVEIRAVSIQSDAHYKHFGQLIIGDGSVSV
jgi:hypothetical protein